MVLALCTTLSAKASAPQKKSFLSSVPGKLPLHNHGLVLVAVAIKFLYGMDGWMDASDANSEEAVGRLGLSPYTEVVTSLHRHRIRLMTDEWGFPKYAETPLSHGAVYAASEAQGDASHERVTKKRSTSPELCPEMDFSNAPWQAKRCWRESARL